MTKVLHVLNDVGNHGNGIINAVVDLACEQERRGDEVWIASAGGGYEALLAEHRVRHLALSGIRDPRRLVRSARLLRRHVAESQAEVVHVHMNYAAVVARAALWRTPVPLVASAHTAFKPAASLLRCADVVFAFGAAGARTMRRRGVPGQRIRTLQNGTVGSVRSSGQDVADLARPAVTTVAGMYPRKGIDVLIRAFAQVAEQRPDAHLHLVGDGPARAEFQDQAAGTPCADRIHFHGFRKDVPAVLRATDVFVLPSRRDPFPLVVLEARQAGCAVVASDVDGIPEAVDGGAAGLLVPVGDVDALAAALSTLLDDPAALASWRAAAGRDLERFTIGRVASDVDAVYQQLLGSAHP